MRINAAIQLFTYDCPNPVAGLSIWGRAIEEAGAAPAFLRKGRPKHHKGSDEQKT
jgi:hypothetical protein